MSLTFPFVPVDGCCSRPRHARDIRGRFQRPAFTVGQGSLAALMVLAISSARAQQALRDSMTGEAAAEARATQLQSLPYTVKWGDFKLLVAPSLSLNWNDNINLSKDNPKEDVILQPNVQLTASYPITAYNVLCLNVGAGYEKYFAHDQYSTWTLQSGTQLSFDTYVKDFWFNFHDFANYIQDPAQQPTLANTANAASYATINNTAGFSATWDLNQATLSAGYDHATVISTAQQFNSQNSSTENLYARAGLKVNPSLTTGLETTAAFMKYDETILNNNNNYSVGVYADWQPGKALDVQPRAGYTISQFGHTSQSIETSDVGSWYADLKISHQITDYIGYSLDAGHEVQAGIQADAVEDWYVRPTVHWNAMKNLRLAAGFSYEHGNQGQGNVIGNLTETYDWMGANFSIGYSIIKRLSVALNYRLTVRSSNTSTDEYTQNLVGINFTYLTP